MRRDQGQCIIHRQVACNITAWILRSVLNDETVPVERSTRQRHDSLDDQHSLPSREVAPVVYHATDPFTSPTVENGNVGSLENANPGIQGIMDDKRIQSVQKFSLP